MTTPGAAASSPVGGAEVLATAQEVFGADQVAQLPTPILTPPPGSGGLGKAAATGFAFMSAQSIASRVLSFFAQFLMARLLTPVQFGLFGMASTVGLYAGLAQQMGVREVLVARGKRFSRWSNIGFWISLLTGVIASLLLVVAIPPTVGYFNQPGLVGLMLLIAFTQPLFGLATPYEAKLQVDLRFKRLSLLQFIQTGLYSTLQVCCALLGMGAYSFVAPRLLLGPLRVWLARRAAPIPIRRDPQIRHWKHFLRPGAMVLLTNLAYILGPSAPVFVLGRMVGVAAVGYFNFASGLSSQALWLISTQLDMVMFPTFGRLAAEPARQRAAFVRACRALAAAVVPLCVFQAVAARPIILLVFGTKWEPSVAAYQALNIGMIVVGSLLPAQSLLQAQSRFGTNMAIAMTWAVIESVACVVGVKIVGLDHAVEGASIGVALGFVGGGINNCVAATRPLGGGFRDVGRIMLPALVPATAAAAAALAVERLVPGSGSVLYAAQIAAMGTAGGLVYAALLRAFAPGVWNDLMGAAGPVLRRLGIRRRARVDGTAG